MHARKVLQNALRNYRLQIPVIHQLEEDFSSEMILYFKESQFYLLEKIFLFAKKTFFNRKEYDLCDNFDNLVKKGKKSFYIIREKKGYSETMLMQMLKMSMGLIVCEKGLDRRSVLYNKKGHKKIQIKRVRKIKINYNEEKASLAKDKI